MSTTIRAQPIEAAVVASADLRAVTRIANPKIASTAGNQAANRLRWRAREICVIAGSKTPRNVGWNATEVSDVVSAENATGMLMIQLLTAVPITASGWFATSGPQPRS